MKKEQEHIGLIESFFTERCIFQETDKSSIKNIAIGLIAPECVNVDCVQELGIKILDTRPWSVRIH